MKKIKAAIVGGSGYGGSELLRILLFHPAAEIAFITANEQAGKRVSDVHRNLLDMTDLVFEPSAPGAQAFTDVDVVFFALPHGQAMEAMKRLPVHVKAIDLSGDFRLNDKEIFHQYYSLEHTNIDQQSRFVYGLTEADRDGIRSAQYIANPGCFATATLLAVIPLTKSGLVTGRIVVDGKTGSSGSGVRPASNTHHPQRVNSFYAYKPFVHQHTPEITQQLETYTGYSSEVVFMSHSMPVTRGIFASCYAETTVNLTKADVRDLFTDYYQDRFFIRLVEGSPDINWVKNTNFCDIGVFSNGKQIVILSAIDNLVKGAAGQAVQNMNLMFGLEETTGLIFTGSNP